MEKVELEAQIDVKFKVLLSHDKVDSFWDAMNAYYE